MTTSFQVSGVLTNVGIQAAIAAGTSGPQMNITGFVIGSNDATSGAVALPTDTVVPNIVYVGSVPQMQYLVVDADTCMIRIELDTTIGNFSVGTIGLLLAGGILFAQAVFPGPSVKYANSPPTTTGNIKFYNVMIRLANVADLINLTVIESLNAAVPEVSSELLLPAASSSPFNLYMVDNMTQYGVPATALRLANSWYYALHRTNAGQGCGVITTTPSQFDTPVPAIACVYIGGSGLFEIADGANTTKYPIGIRTSTYEVTCEGMVSATAVGLTAPLTPGQIYYCNTGVSSGQLTTSVVGNPVAYSVSTTGVYVSMSDNFGGVTSGSPTILYHSGVDTGTANSYILSTTNPTVTALPNGTMVCFVAAHAPSSSSPTSSTLTVGSFGPYPLVRDDGVNPLTTDMVGVVCATFFSGKWYIPIGAVNVTPTTQTPSLPCHGIDTGSIYHYRITSTYPTCTQVVPGTTVMFTAAKPPDGQQQCYLQVEGFGPYSCNRDDGNNLTQYDITGIVTAVFNGSNFVVKRGVYPQSTNIPTTLNFTGIDTSSVANKYNIATPNPTPTQCIQGTTVIFKPAHPPNGNACTMQFGQFGPFPLIRADNSNPLPADMLGMVVTIFDGSSFVISASKAGRLISSTPYTSSTTYYPSAGMTYVYVRLGGGGAGGGGVNVPNVGYCGLNAPGCSGAYGEAIFTASAVGTAQSIVIGAAGVGGSTSSTSPTPGGTTAFGSLCNCPGGTAVNNYVNAPAPCKVECSVATSAPIGCNVVSVPGTGGSPSIAINASTVICGYGGDHPFGSGGRGINNGTAAASPGGYCSGGGSGACYSSYASPVSGQNGAQGYLWIEEFGV